LRDAQPFEDISGLLRISRGGKVPTDHEKCQQPAVHLDAHPELRLSFPLLSDAPDE